MLDNAMKTLWLWDIQSTYWGDLMADRLTDSAWCGRPNPCWPPENYTSRLSRHTGIWCGLVAVYLRDCCLKEIARKFSASAWVERSILWSDVDT